MLAHVKGEAMTVHAGSARVRFNTVLTQLLRIVRRRVVPSPCPGPGLHGTRIDAGWRFYPLVFFGLKSGTAMAVAVVSAPTPLQTLPVLPVSLFIIILSDQAVSGMYSEVSAAFGHACFTLHTERRHEW